MAGSDSSLDAYLVFGNGTAGLGKDAPAINGESADEATNFDDELVEFYPMQLTNYKLGFKLETEGTEETKDKGGETSAHEPELVEVTVTKQLDSASPALLKALCLSACYEKVWIWQRKAGGQKGMAGDYFLKIRLGTVYVAGIDWDASDGPPTETITLKYQQINIQYIPQSATGKLEKKAAVSYEWPERGHRHPRKRDKVNGAGSADLSASQVQDVVNKVMQKISQLNPQLHIRVR